MKNKFLSLLVLAGLLFSSLPVKAIELPENTPDPLNKFNTESKEPAEFIPNDTAYTLELNLNDDTQRQALVNFLTKIKNSFETKEKDDAYFNIIVNNLLYQNHIFLSFELPVDDKSEDLNGYITLKNDHGQLELILATAKAEGNEIKLLFTDEKIPYYQITIDDEPFYLTSLDKVLLFSNSVPGLEKMIDLRSTPADSFSADPDQADIQKNLVKDYLLGVHINQTALTDNLSEVFKNTDYQTPLEAKINQKLLNLASIVKKTSVAFKVEDNRFRLVDYTIGNESALNELGFTFSDFTVKKSLQPKFAGHQLFMFAEASNLKKILALYLETVDEVIKDTNPDANLAEDTKAATGLDVNEDLLSWLGQEFALAVQKQAGLIPAMTLMINASADPDGAKKVLDSLNGQLPNFTTGNPYISLSNLEIDGGQFTQISINLADQIAEQEKIASEDLDNLKKALPEMQIIYGLTADNTFIISNLADFASHVNEGLDKDSEFVQAKSQITIGNVGVSYINFQAVWTYFDELLETVPPLIKEVPPAEFYYFYSQFQSWIYTLKNVVGSGHAEDFTKGNEALITLTDAKPTLNYENFINKLKSLDSDNDGVDDYTEAFVYHTDSFTADDVSATNFTDVNKEIWFSQAVGALSNQDVIHGYNTADGISYKPDQPVTRAEFTKMVVEAFDVPVDYNYPDAYSQLDQNGRPDPKSYPDLTIFSDIYSTDWYFSYVYSAQKAGLISGYSDKTFHPNQPISRAEALVVVLKASGNSSFEANQTKSPLEDTYGHWVEAYINYAYSQNLVKGINPTTFDPNRPVNRAEGAVMIYNLQKFNLENIAKKGIKPQELERLFK